MGRAKTHTRTAEALQCSPFIILTPSQAKLDPAIRKQVRSYVMRGKNRKSHSLHDKVAVGSWINGRQGLELGQPTAADQGIPRRVGNDMTHIPFADEMKPYMQDLAFKWFTILKNAMYPIEACVQPSNRQWVEYLAYDRAYVHSVLFAAQGFFDYVREARFGNVTMRHLTSALNMLRQNLLSKDLATSDSTISTVLTLTLMADILGDTDAARQHIQGLYQMVSLRGGIRSLGYNSELQSKVLRADLGIAISTGSKPLFFASGFSWDSYLAPRDAAGSSSSSHRNNISSINTPFPALTSDLRLLNTAADLQQFSVSANLAFQTGLKMPADAFHEILVSVQYRLLALQHEHDEALSSLSLSSSLPSSSKHKCRGEQEKKEERQAETLLRLGMLAFTTTTFLQIQELPMRYPDLAARMRRAVNDMADRGKAEGGEEMRRLELWFLFVARISVVGGVEDEEMLARAAKEALKVLGLMGIGSGAGWREVRDVLKGYMWIDWVHSARGLTFYMKLVES
ncbi:hypothetical protein MMYC01_206332 [Madurella mycetomatis]|uniref:Uncharacterized protein n=1 Tax=Madurella mycetomatis TaxID=100816 RepID=A0A175W1H2_9PEZI|nr:hypothetical protein MMYC01_206332 [Madurella mycetomatis]